MVTDEEIVKEIQQGNKNKFGEILKRYEGRLYGYLKNLTNQPPEEVEDIVEEVLISAYINLQGFDIKKKFSSWIFRIAHNKAIDYFKKRRVKTKTIEDSEEFIGDGQKLFEELEIEKERNLAIIKGIESLDLKYKEVVLLYYFDDKSYEEISDILHIPTGNVGVILFRAKKLLKEKLSK